MLATKSRRTKSMSDLQTTVIRAQGMVEITPLSHPERLERVRDWVRLMLIRAERSGLQEDLDEVMFSAQQAGAVVRPVPREGDGGRTGNRPANPMYVYLMEAEEYRLMVLSPTLETNSFRLPTTSLDSTTVACDLAMFRIDPDLSVMLDGLTNEELDSFVDLVDPSEEEQIELHIYTSFLIFAGTSPAACQTMDCSDARGLPAAHTPCGTLGCDIGAVASPQRA